MIKFLTVFLATTVTLSFSSEWWGGGLGRILEIRTEINPERVYIRWKKNNESIIKFAYKNDFPSEEAYNRFLSFALTIYSTSQEVYDYHDENVNNDGITGLRLKND